MSKQVLIDESKKPEESGNKIDFGKVDTSEYKKPEVKVNEIDDFLKDYSQAFSIDNSQNDAENSDTEEKPKKRRGRRKKSEPQLLEADGIISGALFITIIDLILPMAIATVNNVIDKNGQKVSAHQLKMTQTQRNELEPIATEIMKQAMIKGNPMFLLVLSMIGIYGGNFVQQKFGV